MDQRSIKPGIPAAQAAGTGIFHPTMTHPKTGEPLEAVYVTKRGVVMWPVMGASPDDDSNDDGGDDDDADDDDDDDSDDDDNDGDDDGDKKKSKAQKKIDALEEEKDRHYKRRKKAEKERDALKAEIEALKAKQGKPAKKAKAKADDADDDSDDDDSSSELEAERAARRREKEESDAATRKLKIENAFLSAGGDIEWVRPGQVMALLLADDDYEVEFDDNGNVDRKSLKAELKRFAKANPHLVKQKAKSSDADGDKGDDNSGDNAGKKSGSAMNGQRKGKGKQPPTREELAKKYPALQQR